MSILNVNQIQPVGSGQTITISASDITASSATITASSVTATTVTSSSTSTFSSGLNVTGGSVGIGTDNASAAKLDVRGSDNPLLKLTQTTSGIARLNIESETNDGYQYAGIGIGSATADAELMWTTLGFDVNVADSVRLRIPSSGDVQVLTGNLVIGTSGKGIDFSATANSSGSTSSELLDDYEEGTWTCSVTGGTFSNLSTGRYTKIGRQVFAYISPTVTAITGNLTISGLPFTAAERSALLVTTVAPGSVTYIPDFVQSATMSIRVTGTWSGSASSTYFACIYEV